MTPSHWHDATPLEVEIVGVANLRTRAMTPPPVERPEPRQMRCALCLRKTLYRVNKRFCSERCRLRARYVVGVGR